MRYLEKLLNGAPVEWKPLGEVCHSIRTGLNPRRFFKLNPPNGENYYITIRELNNGYIQPTPQTDKINDEGLALCQNRSKLEVGDLIFSGTGTIGKMAVVTKQPSNWNIKEGLYAIKPIKEKVSARYLYHLLYTSAMRDQMSQLAAGGTVQSISMTKLGDLLIPIPPLSVQKEIVRILDRFTEFEAELETELKTELEGRRKQYAYYRDLLLTFGPEVERRPLGDVTEIVRGNGLQKKDLIATGIPAIHYGQIYTYYGSWTNSTISFVDPKKAEKLRKVYYGDIIITNTSENLEDVGKALAYLCNATGVTGGHASIIRASNYFLPKFLVYYTQAADFQSLKRKYTKGTKVIDLSAKDLAKIEIPIPPLAEQERIVEILDRFETLAHSISEGLPHEIELRQKQYAYYRDRLLDFPHP